MDPTKVINQATKQFTKVVKLALQHFHDPQWLVEESLLATPYMLGNWLTDLDSMTTELAPAAALQAVLMDAIQSIEQHDNNRAVPWAALLRMRYIERPERKVYQIVESLNTSEPAYHRHHNNALSQLADELLNLLKPALKLETPRPFPFFFGRDQQLVQHVRLLQDAQSFSITGVSGVGKSTYASALANNTDLKSTFWFTIQPGLNDHINNVIVSLGYFLHQCGISSVWMQIVSENHQIQDTTIQLLYYELANLAEKDILLIFDEVDLLRISEVEAHARLVPFLRGLCGLLPLIFVGQKLIIETDQIVELQGIAPDAAQQMFHQAGFKLQNQQLLDIHRQTQGNPRLLELVLTRLHIVTRENQPLEDALLELSDEPSVEFLLRRIWSHLNQHEMYLLELLAIFKQSAPRSAWVEIEIVAALSTLLKWRLLQADGHGGVTMLPIIRETVSRLIDADEAEMLHHDAAQICLAHQQFTQSAYHYKMAGAIDVSIHLLKAHLEHEIDQGQARLAQSVVRAIPINKLVTDQDKESLRYLQAKLHQVLGEQTLAMEALQKSLWRVPFLQVQAKRLEGDITESIGQTNQALRAYKTAHETVEQLLSESASLHRARGYLFTYEHEFDFAQTEIWRIRHDAANLEGFMLMQKGDIPNALNTYLEAIDYAEKAGYAYGIANAKINLGCIYGWQRDLDSAESCLQEAIHFFEMTNRVNKLAEANYNLAFARRLAERYVDALEPAETAYKLFERVGRELGQSITSQILGETYLGLNKIELAESCIQRVIDAEFTNTQADGLRCLGEIRLKQGRIIEAEKLMQSALKITQETEDGIIEAYVLRSLAIVYLAGKNELQARECLAQATEIFNNANMDVEVRITQEVCLDIT